MACIISHLHVAEEVDRKHQRTGRPSSLLWQRKKKGEMGGILMQHHQISSNPLQKTAFPGSSALNKDGVLLRVPRQGFLRSSSATIIRSEGTGSPLPRTVKKHSKEELIAFFRSIQTSIGNDSPKTSKRTRKKSPDPFEDVERRKQSYEEHTSELYQDGQPKSQNLDDMKVAELREMARARRMRGYSKLKKRELIDRLKGVVKATPS